MPEATVTEALFSKLIYKASTLCLHHIIIHRRRMPALTEHMRQVLVGVQESLERRLGSRAFWAVIIPQLFLLLVVPPQLS